MKKFNIIAAVNNDSIIGVKEYGTFSMPWPYLKDDMNHFRKITTDTGSIESGVNAIIVGFNTWQTLPSSYRNIRSRFNIVISRDDETDGQFHKYVKTFDEAIEFASSLTNLNEIFVIGGGVIYDLALKHKLLDKLYLTHVGSNYPIDDNVEKIVYFPLTWSKIEKMCDSNFLELDSEISKRDIGKNIVLRFQEYSVKKELNQAIEYLKKNTSLDNKEVIGNKEVTGSKGYSLEQHDYYSTEYFWNLYGFITRKVFDLFNLSNEISVPNEEYPENQYIELVKTIMEKGIIKQTRNSITKSIFGYQLKYDLSKGYPIQTIKRSYPKAIFEELMWMIRGQTDVSILQKKGVHVWDKNSSKDFLSKYNLPYEEGDIGPGYGFQMRYWGAEYTDCKTSYQGQGIDQLNKCIESIQNNPHDRRIMINLWNCSDLDKMALAPCHFCYMFGVDLYDVPTTSGKKGRLNCHLVQRSWDVLLGWNTTTAALLTYLLANHCDLDPGILVHSISDAHIYQSHIDSGAIDQLLQRKCRKFPNLVIRNKKEKIDDYEFDDLTIENYYPCPSISAEMIA
ncbi:bifunctional dihydrofolate reductase-thymidylate synthase [Acanthamoeba polyphaga mimivirus]|uniref:thymidylate synthase n=1 Tax=Acanthamoeba polyphaga mimivirus Kroon TaxID=3069720 RepID=A0A0G2Y380_9VIRU|nr:bifunctional dihydrofolate reductase-thymidylate synthase [Acanthamoeba polyphaga mimivirus]AKI80230.1 bifunctional dihydrofolate reductase-thymidylate synthase [Acanthamoeba polyphaga mimivirus Kroon]